jgi:HAE1 family hydrophobic/amphiphilic exporter-1
MFLSDLSIKRPVLATMMILALVTLGIVSYRRLAIDQWPNVELPFVGIRPSTRAPAGASAGATKKIEEAVNWDRGHQDDAVHLDRAAGHSSSSSQREGHGRGRRALKVTHPAGLPREIDPPVTALPVTGLRHDPLGAREAGRCATSPASPRRPSAAASDVQGVGSVSVVGGLAADAPCSCPTAERPGRLARHGGGGTRARTPTSPRAASRRGARGPGAHQGRIATRATRPRRG